MTRPPPMTNSGKRRRRQQATDQSIGRFLHASAVQIEAATNETQEELEGLTQLLIALAQHASGMNRRLDNFARLNLEPQDMAAIREEIASLDAAAMKTISRLQFADRLHQRLSNVQGNLDALAELMGQPDVSPGRWTQFLQDSRDNFTMEHERELFDRVLQEDLGSPPANDSQTDNIALFDMTRGGKDVV